MQQTMINTEYKSYNETVKRERVIVHLRNLEYSEDPKNVITDSMYVKDIVITGHEVIYITDGCFYLKLSFKHPEFDKIYDIVNAGKYYCFKYCVHDYEHPIITAIEDETYVIGKINNFIEIKDTTQYINYRTDYREIILDSQPALHHFLEKEIRLIISHNTIERLSLSTKMTKKIKLKAVRLNSSTKMPTTEESKDVTLKHPNIYIITDAEDAL